MFTCLGIKSIESIEVCSGGSQRPVTVQVQAPALKLSTDLSATQFAKKLLFAKLFFAESNV